MSKNTFLWACPRLVVTYLHPESRGNRVDLKRKLWVLSWRSSQYVAHPTGINVQMIVNYITRAEVIQLIVHCPLDGCYSSEPPPPPPHWCRSESNLHHEFTRQVGHSKAQPLVSLQWNYWHQRWRHLGLYKSCLRCRRLTVNRPTVDMLETYTR